MFREILLIIISIIFISCNFQKKEDKSAINKKDTIVKTDSYISMSKEGTKIDTVKSFNEILDKTLDTLPPKKKRGLLKIIRITWTS